MWPAIFIIVISLGISQWNDHDIQMELHQEIAELRYQVIDLQKEIKAPK